MEKFFTSESVTSGHPDKVCDRIADAILDEILKKDENGRVACEVTCTTGLISLFGEISTNCYVDMPKIARRVVKNIGYDDPKYGFHYKNCAVVCNIDEQSKDIYDGVFKKDEDALNCLKAGDQGILFGFACNETKELMPMPISYAHKLAKRLDYVRKEKIIPYLGPDGKTQVTVKYVDDVPKCVSVIVISTQHDDGVSLMQLEKDIVKEVILKVIPRDLLDSDTKFLINPSGRFVLGGPASDSGLTGRKIIVDTFGGFSRHGGGAFSGKDPTKVDRSGAYFARYVAKNIVAASLAKKCEVQISYAIGVLNPVSIMVETFRTGVVEDFVLTKIVKELLDFRPAAIIKKLGLKAPIYEKLSNYGHFGREDLNVNWEKTDMVEKLREKLHSLKFNLKV